MTVQIYSKNSISMPYVFTGLVLAPVIGGLLFAAGALALYLAAAIVNNHIYGRAVLPTFGSVIASD